MSRRYTVFFTLLLASALLNVYFRDHIVYDLDFQKTLLKNEKSDAQIEALFHVDQKNFQKKYFTIMGFTIGKIFGMTFLLHMIATLMNIRIRFAACLSALTLANFAYVLATWSRNFQLWLQKPTITCLADLQKLPRWNLTDLLGQLPLPVDLFLSQIGVFDLLFVLALAEVLCRQVRPKSRAVFLALSTWLGASLVFTMMFSYLLLGRSGV